MKKLFFTALVAIVAVGGAFAVEYSAGSLGAGQHFTCDGAVAPTCSSEYSSGAYRVSDNAFINPLPSTNIELIP